MKDEQHFPNLRRLRNYDRELLASAVRELSRATPAYTGTGSSTRSRVFAARREGVCVRCGSMITVGQDIRYHREYGDYAHDGCRPPKVTVRTADRVFGPQPRAAKSMPERQPQLCPECHLEHAGGCF